MDSEPQDYAHSTSEKFPKSVIYLFSASALICVPMIALAIVNFGLLSMWLNATVAVLVLIHHVFFSYVAWSRRSHFTNITKPLVFEDATALLAPQPIAYELWNVLVIGFLFIITSLAFGIMIDVTTRGPLMSTLPIERIGSPKWDLKVQYGQITVLGVELLVLGIVFVVCVLGRRRVVEHEENLYGELDYGMMPYPSKKSQQ